MSDDFGSGTAAAAVGGTTTVIEYVTTTRGQRPLDALATWQREAEPAAIDYGFHMTLVDAASEADVADCVEQGITSFKLYMAYPETLQVDDDVIVDVLRHTGKHGGLVTVHAENGGAITSLRREALLEGRTGVIEHSRTRPAVVEGEATARAAMLAEVVEAPIYIVHVSSAPALAAIRTAQERGVTIMGETCPQYLHLDVTQLEGPGGENFVCTPPLRDPWHHEEPGTAWVRATCTRSPPTTARSGCTTAGRHSRARGRWADFTEIPGGLPGIETRPAPCGPACAPGTSRRPTGCGCAPRRRPARSGCGRARARFGSGPMPTSSVGSERTQSLDASALHMRTDHSPYEGQTATGWPELVLSRGRVVARDGRFTGEAGLGSLLPQTRSVPDGHRWGWWPSSC